jgi:hypothetical protein
MTTISIGTDTAATERDHLTDIDIQEAAAVSGPGVGGTRQCVS